ncbi:SGNH/GDSL hydrolase family protein [Bacillus sp. Au-Bac7]|uniref:SGNH/GDSL hydrolase family protein n=1 Tax=Bacillus sp. Au-Bac7 TaxID=2906458 RepID=UPI001E43DA90|nr:SGNH/GDSL hydrolase family protein [Bacillus sp. Au-Bac7]MCE4051849.1 phage tail protein [Bacillus sp. Au-Bac7]
MFYIDYKKQPRDLRLFLLNAKGNIRAELTVDSYNKQQTFIFNDLNQLNFTVPYMVDWNHKRIINPNIKKVTKKNRILAVIYNEENEKIYEEIYTVIKRVKSFGDSGEELQLECKSRGYDLNRYKIIGYEVISYNLSQVTNDCLKSTGWSVGYVNSEFDKMYRSFTISSSTALEFIKNIAETFGAVITYDTINRKINFWKEEEVSVFKGFQIEYGRYLQSLDDSIDNDDIITRLYIKGKDDLTVNGVNPTGQSYIDDFSYFYDEMSEALKVSLEKYTEKLEQNKTGLTELLKNKKELQEALTTLNNSLFTLEKEKQIILDNITIATNGGNSTKALIAQRDSKISEINNVKSQISSTEASVKNIDTNSKTLAESLSYEKNLDSASLVELQEYIYIDEWSDTNIDKEDTLLEEGTKYLKENNAPKVDLNMSIVNFFEVVEEQHNWNRFTIGDIVYVKHDVLETYVKARIQQFSLSYGEDFFINVNVAEGKRISKNPITMITNMLKGTDKVKRDYEYTQADIAAAVTNFNSRNDRISTKPAAPTFNIDGRDIKHNTNDDGTVSLTVSWSYPDYESTNNDAHNIDGFEVFLYTSPLDDSYVFGSTLASEEKMTVSYTNRTLAFNNTVANKYHTVGIRAYRQVDPDISKNRIIYSDIVNSPSSPYKPSEEVVMNGYLNGALSGKVNGTTFITADTEPVQVEDTQTVFINTSTKEIKIANENAELVNINAGSSNSLNGFTASAANVPNTIPIRNASGVLDIGYTVPGTEYFTMTANILGDIDSSTSPSTNQFYWQYVLQQLGLLNVTNYGVNGSNIAVSSGKTNAFVQRYSSMGAADIVLVLGGANDLENSIPLGVMADQVNTTFYGACHVLFSGLVEKYPGKRIGIISPFPIQNKDTLAQYVQAEKEVAAYYSIPFLNLYEGSGISVRNQTIITQFMPDGKNLNNNGHAVIARKIANFIKGL